MGDEGPGPACYGAAHHEVVGAMAAWRSIAASSSPLSSQSTMRTMRPFLSNTIRRLSYSVPSGLSLG